MSFKRSRNGRKIVEGLDFLCILLNVGIVCHFPIKVVAKGRVEGFVDNKYNDNEYKTYRDKFP